MKNNERQKHLNSIRKKLSFFINQWETNTVRYEIRFRQTYIFKGLKGN